MYCSINVFRFYFNSRKNQKVFRYLFWSIFFVFATNVECYRIVDFTLDHFSYRIVTNRVTFLEAERYCQEDRAYIVRGSLGGYLAQIKSARVQNFIVGIIEDPNNQINGREFSFYIGLLKSSDVNFRWPDLTILKSQDYQNWNSLQDQPQSDSRAVCVVIGGYDADTVVNYQWRTTRCATRSGFICQKPIGRLICSSSSLSNGLMRNYHPALRNRGSVGFAADETLALICVDSRATNSESTVEITCNGSGNWIPSSIPSCRPIRCGRPKRISNGNIKRPMRLFNFGTPVEYVCHEGYSATGPVETVCRRQSRTWTLDNNLPECKRTAPGLGEEAQVLLDDLGKEITSNKALLGILITAGVAIVLLCISGYCFYGKRGKSSTNVIPAVYQIPMQQNEMEQYEMQQLPPQVMQYEYYNA